MNLYREKLKSQTVLEDKNFTLLKMENDKDNIEIVFYDAFTDLKSLVAKKDLDLTNLEDPLEKELEDLERKLEEEDLLQTLTEKNYDALITQKKLGLKETEIKSFKSQRIPDLVITSGVSHPSLSDPFWGMFIGGGFEIPLFDRKQGEIKRTEAEREHISLESEALKAEFRANLDKAIFNFKIRKQ